MRLAGRYDGLPGHCRTSPSLTSGPATSSHGPDLPRGTGKGVPTIAGCKVRVRTTYNSADEVVEKKRSFVFYVPISIYDLLILGSRSSLPFTVFGYGLLGTW